MTGNGAAAAASAAAGRRGRDADIADAEAEAEFEAGVETRLRDVVDSIVRHGAPGDLTGGENDTAPTVMCSICEGMDDVVVAYAVAKHHPGGGPIELATLYICANCHDMAEDAAAELRLEIGAGRA